MSFWKRLFVECNFFFTYNEKTNLNILLILSVYRCKKKFFTLIQTILYKLNICNVYVVTLKPNWKKTQFIFILLYFCVYDVASVKSCYSIAGTNKCFVRVVFLNMCPHDQTSSVCNSSDVMCVFPQMFLSRLSVSEWLSELVLAGRACLTLLLWRDPPFTAHLFAFTSMHLINTLIGCLRSCINV